MVSGQRVSSKLFTFQDLPVLDPLSHVYEVRDSQNIVIDVGSLSNSIESTNLSDLALQL